MKSRLVEIDTRLWNTYNKNFIKELEMGNILFFLNPDFYLSENEKILLCPSILKPKSRNISLNIDNNLKGSISDEATQALIYTLLQRFRSYATNLITSIAPQYISSLEIAATSFRPIKVEERKQSYRADDKRIHVDAFPTRPTYGKRILRVFINVNPDNEPRVWRIGDEPLEQIAEKFLPELKKFSKTSAKLLYLFKITKSIRSEYDHIMLQLHDAMKRSSNYQNKTHITIPFPAGSIWVCFSDQVPHSVLSGQYMIEQTFYIPVSAQYFPEKSPVTILQGLIGRAIV